MHLDYLERKIFCIFAEGIGAQYREKNYDLVLLEYYPYNPCKK